jgi:hypothetical protein
MLKNKLNAELILQQLGFWQGAARMKQPECIQDT